MPAYFVCQRCPIRHIRTTLLVQAGGHAVLAPLVMSVGFYLSARLAVGPRDGPIASQHGN